MPALLAAAIGAGFDFSAPYARMIVDIGHGVIDVGVIRAGSLIATTAVRFAGANVEEAVAAAIRRHAGIDPAAGEAALLCGQLHGLRRMPERRITVRGHEAGSIREDTATRDDVVEAADAAIDRIARAVAGYMRLSMRAPRLAYNAADGQALLPDPPGASSVRWAAAGASSIRPASSRT